MKGFFGKYLVIDLICQKSYIENINEKELSLCLGGKGLAANLLLRYQPQGVSPYSDENPLIVAVGPVTDTGIWFFKIWSVYKITSYRIFFVSGMSYQKLFTTQPAYL